MPLTDDTARRGRSGSVHSGRSNARAARSVGRAPRHSRPARSERTGRPPLSGACNSAVAPAARPNDAVTAVTSGGAPHLCTARPALGQPALSVPAAHTGTAPGGPHWDSRHCPSWRSRSNNAYNAKNHPSSHGLQMPAQCTYPTIQPKASSHCSIRCCGSDCSANAAPSILRFQLIFPTSLNNLLNYVVYTSRLRGQD